MNTDKEVPYNPAQPQGTQYNSDVQVPIGQAPPRAPSQLPPNAGFNNPGGIVDTSVSTQQAMDGVHYHYHYYGPGAFVSSGPMPGYGTTNYQNPATAPVPTNPYLTPIYGPGNPAPMNTLEGANNDNYNGRVGGGDGGAVAGGVPATGSAAAPAPARQPRSRRLEFRRRGRRVRFGPWMDLLELEV